MEISGTRITTLNHMKQNGENIMRRTTYDQDASVLIDRLSTSIIVIGNPARNVMIEHEKSVKKTLATSQEHFGRNRWLIYTNILEKKTCAS